MVRDFIHLCTGSIYFLKLFFHIFYSTVEVEIQILSLFGKLSFLLQGDWIHLGLNNFPVSLSLAIFDVTQKDISCRVFHSKVWFLGMILNWHLVGIFSVSLLKESVCELNYKSAWTSNYQFVVASFHNNDSTGRLHLGFLQKGDCI